MNRLFLSTMSAVLLGLGAAQAADMRAPIKAPVAVAPACVQFGGFYIGGHVGGAYYRADRNDDDGYFTDNAGHTTTDTGIAGGGHVGYNLQRGCIVFGVEIDGSWTSAKAKFQDDPNASAQIETIDSRLRWFGTARTRTGIVVQDLMLYVTGGLAFANIKNTYSDNNAGQDPLETNTFSKTRWGWTAGFGTEYALSRNWTFRSEALYMQFSQYTNSITSVNQTPNPFRFTNNDSVWVGRVGLTYIFGR